MTPKKNTLFVDFDRTLFNTEEFYRWLTDDPVVANERKHSIITGDINDLSAFLFEDTVPFLEEHGHDSQIVLVTYTTDQLFQKAKIEQSGLKRYFNELIITTEDKGIIVNEFLINQPVAQEHRKFFVDDRHDNVQSVRALNPDVSCVHIDRYGLDSYLSDPKQGVFGISSLQELSQFLQAE